MKKSKTNNPWLGALMNIGLKKQLNYFVENFSLLLDSGLDMVTALTVIEEEIFSSRMKRKVTLLRESVQKGESFSEAARKMFLFQESTLAFIALGEKSGNLVDNLKVLALQNEKEEVFKSKIRSALLYAVIILSLTVIIGVATAWYTLPRIADVYSDMGADLPALTKFLIWMGEFIAKYGAVVLPFFMLLLLLTLYFIFSFPKTKFIGHTILFHIPVIKKLIREVEVSRFGFLLGTMLESGLTISEALEAMQGTTTFNNYKKLYKHLSESIRQGTSLTHAIKKYPDSRTLLTPGVRQIIVAAERGGSLSKSMKKIGSIYEIRAEMTSKNIPTALEPIMLLIIGIGVAIFVLGTIAPIYNLTTFIE